jgi:hypothetical protein
MPALPEAAAPVRPRTPVFGAFLEGWRRVLRAPGLTAGVLAATFMLALPLGIAMADAIETHLGSSVEAERALEGWPSGWAAEFGAQAQGIARTFTHEFLGFGGTLAIISTLVDREPLNPVLAAGVAASIALWMFLSGGILDRLARGRPVRAAAFFSACGVYFVRFVRLAVLVGAAYWALFRWLHPYLFGTLYSRFTRDMTGERDAIVVRAVLYAVFVGALALVNLVADFAKVRAVVEDRRSMLGAVGASLRFVRRRFFRVVALYLLNAIALLLILRMWLSTAPSAGAATWVALLAAEVYLLARVWAKLAFMASEVVFFQGELAHAQYTASPEPVWPDSPAAEAIDNLTARAKTDP